ncbi:hypothetical protein NP233_g11352 [Leucocoprinus birnbaumii]|uniref:Uncharacterized protein n=1 Tax=Leucocoprinus birnbaumii TaxID=56174 RepID=A0AAD5YP21_9AGAR|nr:hypothetical protein NP233_g11352 [Leucocoprinus birnbaumii]
MIIQGATGIVREDMQWFKIKINNVRTRSKDGNGEEVYTSQFIHNHLTYTNLEYRNIADHIVLKPRWVHPKSKTKQQAFSSVVFAVDLEEVHKVFLKHKSLSVFGELVKTCAWSHRGCRLPPDGRKGLLGHSAWIPILPKSTLKHNEPQPRVMAYVQCRPGLKVALRSNIVQDTDIQVLSISYPDKSTTIIVNLYNDKTHNLVDNNCGVKYNIKDMKKEDWVTAFNESLLINYAPILAIMDERADITTDDLKCAATALTTAINQANEKAAKVRKPSPHAKPWWSKELAQTAALICNLQNSQLVYLEEHGF